MFGYTQQVVFKKLTAFKMFFKFTIFTYLYIKRLNSIYQSARLIKYDILEHLM